MGHVEYAVIHVPFVKDSKASICSPIYIPKM